MDMEVISCAFNIDTALILSSRQSSSLGQLGNEVPLKPENRNLSHWRGSTLGSPFGSGAPRSESKYPWLPVATIPKCMAGTTERR